MKIFTSFLLTTYKKEVNLNEIEGVKRTNTTTTEPTHMDLKPLVPSQNVTCWFCKNKTSNSKSSILQPLYYITYRYTNPFGRVSTKYNTTAFIVPRCLECEKEHNNMDNIGCISALLVGMIISFILIVSSPNTFTMDLPTYIWTLFLVELLVSYPILFIVRGLKPKRTKPYNYLEEFAPISKLLTQDWMLGEKPTYKGNNIDRINNRNR